MIAVLLCDGDRAARIALAATLRADPDIAVLAEAPDGAELLRMARWSRPDVVLVATELPDGDGFRIARQLVDQLPGPVMVAFLAGQLDRSTILQGLRSGGRAFLTSTGPACQTLAVVRMLAAGYGLLPSAAASLLAVAADSAPTSSRDVVSPDPTELTSRELDVLELIADGRSNTQIAAALGLAESTVKAHVSCLLSKLGLRHRGQAIAVAYGAGLVPIMPTPGTTGGLRPVAAPPAVADPQ